VTCRIRRCHPTTSLSKLETQQSFSIAAEVRSCSRCRESPSIIRTVAEPKKASLNTPGLLLLEQIYGATQLTYFLPILRITRQCHPANSSWRCHKNRVLCRDGLIQETQGVCTTPQLVTASSWQARLSVQMLDMPESQKLPPAACR
jgi:hypothetical protein